jgi:hypothetical protein
MQKWEYLNVVVIYQDDTIHSRNFLNVLANNEQVLSRSGTGLGIFFEYLKSLGILGWELVNVLPTDRGASYHFKRPIE